MENQAKNGPFEALKALVKDAGTQADAAAQLGIKPQYLCDILHKRRGISARIAKALGFKKTVVFQADGLREWQK